MREFERVTLCHRQKAPECAVQMVGALGGSDRGGSAFIVGGSLDTARYCPPSFYLLHSVYIQASSSRTRGLHCARERCTLCRLHAVPTDLNQSGLCMFGRSGGDLWSGGRKRDPLDPSWYGGGCDLQVVVAAAQ